MQGWYRGAVDRPLTPDRVAIVTMTAERVEVYGHIPLQGQQVPVGVQLFPEEESILEEK